MKDVSSDKSTSAQKNILSLQDEGEILRKDLVLELSREIM